MYLHEEIARLITPQLIHTRTRRRDVGGTIVVRYSPTRFTYIYIYIFQFVVSSCNVKRKKKKWKLRCSPQWKKNSLSHCGNTGVSEQWGRNWRRTWILSWQMPIEGKGVAVVVFQWMAIPPLEPAPPSRLISLLRSGRRVIAITKGIYYARLLLRQERMQIFFFTKILLVNPIYSLRYLILRRNIYIYIYNIPVIYCSKCNNK